MSYNMAGKTDAQQSDYYAGIVAAIVTDNEPALDKRMMDYLRGAVRRPGVEAKLNNTQRNWLRARGIEFAWSFGSPVLAGQPAVEPDEDNTSALVADVYASRDAAAAYAATAAAEKTATDTAVTAVDAAAADSHAAAARSAATAADDAADRAEAVYPLVAADDPNKAASLTARNAARSSATAANTSATNAETAAATI